MLGREPLAKGQVGEGRIREQPVGARGRNLALLQPSVCVLGGGVPALLLLCLETPIASVQLFLSPSAIPKYGSPGRATGHRPQNKRVWDP